MRVRTSLVIVFVGLWVSDLYVLWSCTVDLDEIISCVHDSDTPTFITWFDDYGLVIFEVLQYCCFPLKSGYCRISNMGC